MQKILLKVQSDICLKIQIKIHNKKKVNLNI